MRQGAGPGLRQCVQARDGKIPPLLTRGQQMFPGPKRRSRDRSRCFAPQYFSSFSRALTTVFSTVYCAYFLLFAGTATQGAYGVLVDEIILFTYPS